MAKYDVLDSLILQHIANGCTTFSDIYFGKPGSSNNGSYNGVYAECGNLVKGSQDPARVLDRRLQALRKKGAIHYNSGWFLP